MTNQPITIEVPGYKVTIQPIVPQEPVDIFAGARVEFRYTGDTKEDTGSSEESQTGDSPSYLGVTGSRLVCDPSNPVSQ